MVAAEKPVRRPTGHLDQGVLDRDTSIASGNRSTQRSLRGRGRAIELEGADLGFPQELPRWVVILVCVPEGRVIRRIQTHGSVIAPAIARQLLHTSAGEHGRLTLRQHPGRITQQPSRIGNGREDTKAGG